MADNRPAPEPLIHPDAPHHRSPIKIMAAMMLFVVAISVWEMTKEERRSVTATITIPQLGQLEQRGRKLFNGTCAECHGADARGGSKSGPPLMHPYYRSKLISDDDIRRIIRLGAPQRLWKFGFMPSQPDIDPAEAEAIVAFYNALRGANGLLGPD